MPRPTNKAELLEQSKKTFDQLVDLVDSIPAGDRTKPGVNGDWSVKDILAHLYVWNDMMEGWYKEGITGKKPVIPAPGYTFKDTPKLNEKIFQDHKGESLDQVVKNFKEAHNVIMKIVEKHTDEELFTKKKYAWTGSTSMDVYFRVGLASHYRWAIGLIKKWLKSKS